MRLIDADKFKEDLMKLWDYSCVDGITATTVLKQVMHDLDNAPTIIWCSKTSEGYPLMDLRHREKGEWIRKVDDVGFVSYICSECGAEIEVEDPMDDKFCFNCGAKMKGGKE